MWYLPTGAVSTTLAGSNLSFGIGIALLTFFCPDDPFGLIWLSIDLNGERVAILRFHGSVDFPFHVMGWVIVPLSVAVPTNADEIFGFVFIGSNSPDDVVAVKVRVTSADCAITFHTSPSVRPTVYSLA